MASMPLTREELNKEAGAILARAERVAEGRGRAREATDDAVAIELRTECQTLRADIKQLKRHCAQFLAAAPLPASRDEICSYTTNLLVEEERLRAELAVLQRQRPTDAVSTHSAVLQSSTHQQVRESCSQQNQLLTALRNERKRAEAELKREQALLAESRELEAALEKRLAGAQGKSGRQTHSSAEAELRERLSLAEESVEYLRDNLIQFCADEIAQPSDEREGERKKKRGGQERVDAMLLRGGKGGREDSRNHFPSLPDVLQELISKTLTTPHAPYLPLSSVWPPHGNLLLRSGVIQRHPDNPSLIRVTPFHL